MLSFFPLDVFDEIWDLIESVSEVFLIYCLVFLVILDVDVVSGYLLFFLLDINTEIGLFLLHPCAQVIQCRNVCISDLLPKCNLEM